jgi:4-hydroxy-tetrahydrodipicolinate reductase
MTKKLRLSVVGATGKLGSKIICKLADHEKCSLQHAMVKAKSSYVGTPLASFFPTSPLPLIFESNYEKMVQDSDVIIDVSHPESLARYIPHVLKNSIPLVIGVTGYNKNTVGLIKELSSHLPILLAPNFALGIPFLSRFIQLCDEAFHSSSKVTIKEWHHEKKKDMPSGTALELAKALKNKPEIVSYREGDIVGIHTVSFQSGSEVIELTHKALSRDLFAEGAIKAAEFLFNKPNGLYGMEDLLPIA